MDQGFRWVKARAQCSVDIVFERLKLEVQTDVEERALLSPPPCAFGFSFDAKGSTFCVMLTGHQMRQVVKFAISKGAIVATFDDGPLLEGQPTVSDDGKCRLRVNGVELERGSFARGLWSGYSSRPRSDLTRALHPLWLAGPRTEMLKLADRVRQKAEKVRG